MRHPRITIAAIVIAIAGTAGGLGIASAAGGTNAVAQPANNATTIHTAQATISGKTETILVDAKGDPLYTFKADTPTASHVSGQLAALWPPLVAPAAPTASGASGRLTLVSTPNGRQVAYNGRFLYSFVDDAPGHVTGQGVQDFFIATPDTGSAGTPVTSTPSTSGYGY